MDSRFQDILKIIQWFTSFVFFSPHKFLFQGYLFKYPLISSLLLRMVKQIVFLNLMSYSLKLLNDK